MTELELERQPDGAAEVEASPRVRRRRKRAEPDDDGGEDTFHPGAAPTQYVGGLVVPFPYELWGDGLYVRTPKSAPPWEVPSLSQPIPSALRVGRSLLSPRPVWPCAQGSGVEGTAELIQFVYARPDGLYNTIWLTRAEATNLNKLVELGATGFPVDSLSARGLLLFCRTMEAANHGTMPRLQIGERTGPYALVGADGRPFTGYLLGARWIGEGFLAANPRGADRYLNAFVAHGSEEEWFAKWRSLRDPNSTFGYSWVRRFLIGAAFAAPLLRWVNCRTFIIHHWGDSGSAKTAISVFALSAFGDPSKLFSHLNRTAVSLTEPFKYVTDQMVVFDEKQAQTVENHELIYQVCMGVGRERATREGGLRDRASWLSIVRTTGEVPLLGAEDVGGQFNRVLQLHSPAHPVKEQAAELYGFTKLHYGHAGPLFLARLMQLVNDETQAAWLRAEYKALTDELQLHSGAEANHNGYAAVVALGSALAESWLLGLDYADARALALDDARRALTESNPAARPSYAVRALAVLRDHVVANPALYRDERTAEHTVAKMQHFRLHGFLTAWGVALIPSCAEAVLKAAGFDAGRVWRDFRQLGWLLVDDHGDGEHLALALPGHGQLPARCIRGEVFYGAVRPQLRVVQGGRE